MKHKKNYIFTNKDHPEKGIMSTILGTISIAALVIVVMLTYQNGGRAVFKFGTVGVLVTIFSLTGFVLGVISRTQRDKYYLFSYIGIGFNLLALVAIGFILYAGVVGI